MKKVLIVLLVLVLITGGVIGLVAFNSLSISTGRCLVTDNGSVMLVKENYGPIVISRAGNEWMFEGLSTGDEILVVHGFIEETYPAYSGASFVLRLGDGSLEDIPAEQIAQLTELGWLS